MRRPGEERSTTGKSGERAGPAGWAGGRARLTVVFSFVSGQAGNGGLGEGEALLEEADEGAAQVEAGGRGAEEVAFVRVDLGRQRGG